MPPLFQKELGFQKRFFTFFWENRLFWKSCIFVSPSVATYLSVAVRRSWGVKDLLIALSCFSISSATNNSKWSYVGTSMRRQFFQSSGSCTTNRSKLTCRYCCHVIANTSTNTYDVYLFFSFFMFFLNSLAHNAMMFNGRASSIRISTYHNLGNTFSWTCSEHSFCRTEHELPTCKTVRVDSIYASVLLSNLLSFKTDDEKLYVWISFYLFFWLV